MKILDICKCFGINSYFCRIFKPSFDCWYFNRIGVLQVTTSLLYRGGDSRCFPLFLYHWYVYFAFHKIEFSTFSIGFCVLVYTFSIDITMHFCTFSTKLVVVFVKYANKNIEKVWLCTFLAHISVLLCYKHFRMGVFFLKKVFVCRRLCRG